MLTGKLLGAAAKPSLTVSYVGFGSASISSSAQENDICIAWLASAGLSSPPNAPSGFTTLGSGEVGGEGGNISYRVLGAGEGGNSVSCNSTLTFRPSLSSFSIDTGSWSVTASTGTPSIPSFNLSSQSLPFIVCGFASSVLGGNTMTVNVSPADLASAGDGSQGSYGYALGVEEADKTTYSITGNDVGTGNVLGGGWLALY